MEMKAALLLGVAERTRPVSMTALMAAIGIARSNANWYQIRNTKPLAIVVIGGLISAALLTLLLFPLVFQWGYQIVQQQKFRGFKKTNFEDYEN